MRRVLAVICVLAVAVSTLLSVSADNISDIDLSSFEWSLEQAEYIKDFNPSASSFVSGTSTYPQFKSDLPGLMSVYINNSADSRIMKWTRRNNSSTVNYTLNGNSDVSFMPYNVGYNERWTARNFSFNVTYDSAVSTGVNFSNLFTIYTYPAVDLSLSDFSVLVRTTVASTSVSASSLFDVKFFEISSGIYGLLVSSDRTLVEFTSLEVVHLNAKSSASDQFGVVSSQTVVTGVGGAGGSDYTSILNQILSSVNSLPENTYLSFESAISDMFGYLDNIIRKIESFNFDFTTFSGNIYTYFEELPGKIAEALTGTQTDVEQPVTEDNKQNEEIKEGASSVGDYTNISDSDMAELESSVTLSPSQMDDLFGGAFVVKQTFRDMMSIMPEIQSLMFFSLTIGLCMYILNRKLE